MSFFQQSPKSIDLPLKTPILDRPVPRAQHVSVDAEFVRVSNDLEIKNFGDSQLIDNDFINSVPLKEGVVLTVDDVAAKHNYQTEPILLAANGTAEFITSSALEQIGSVTLTVEGPVTALGQDGTPRTLNQGDPVYLHDTIVTGARSHIKITLDDGTLFQLGPNSRASLDKYAYDPEDESGGEFETFVYSGAFRYTTLIGIRGSEIDGKVEEDGSTTVLHLSGLVSITSRHHLGEVIVYERGTSVFIPSEASPLSINQLTPESIESTREQFLPLNLRCLPG